MFPWKKEGVIKGDLSDKTGNNILKELADVPVKKETQYNKTCPGVMVSLR
jgi:hypothetical protein